MTKKNSENKIPSEFGFAELMDDIEAAAIRAERETGEYEETEAEARSHALVRLARMSAGFLITLVGIAALPLPGPGWLIIAGGLAILSKDVEWAARLLAYVRKRVPGIPEDGKIPPATMVKIGLITAAFASLSLWYSIGGGKDIVGGWWEQLLD